MDLTALCHLSIDSFQASDPTRSIHLEAPASGRCGIWSKADSQVLFDDFTVAGP